MDDPLTRDELIDTLETIIEGQLRAVRGLRGGRQRQPRVSSGEKRKSNISIVIDILTAAGTPLHINEIIVRAKRDHGVELKRESLVSALTKKVLDRHTFCRTGRNEFALLEREGA
jgi:hypothetical protein